MEHFPHRLRALRRQHELSLEQLAQRTGLTKSYLSKVERGLSEPSISSTLKLAQAYSVGVGWLLGTAEDGVDDQVSVVRHDQRELVAKPGTRGETGYRYEALSGTRLIKAMEPFILYPPRRNEGRPFSVPHAGEEFMFVLKGTVHVAIGSRELDLEAGDSLYFDSELPHRLYTTSAEDAEVLVVATRTS